MVQGFHKRKTLKYFPISGHVLNLSCSGGHLEFLIYNNLEYIVWGHPMIIHVHFGFNQISSVWKKKYFHFSLTVICKYIRPPMVAILNFQPPPPKKRRHLVDYYHGAFSKVFSMGQNFTTKEMISIFPLWTFHLYVAPAYVVYISQLIRYSRACGSYQDFFGRGLMLTRKILIQGYLLVTLKSSLRKFYGCQHDLVNHYRIYMSQMMMDMFHLPYALPGPFLIHDLSPGLSLE
jgi:hypothetical protein